MAWLLEWLCCWSGFVAEMALAKLGRAGVPRALRHCERSEAIQWARSQRRGLDCFVAYAPRNDAGVNAPRGRLVIASERASLQATGRHCERTGRHCERSEAIQRRRAGAEAWIASSLTLLAMTRTPTRREDAWSWQATGRHCKRTGRHCERSEAIHRRGGVNEGIWIASSLTLLAMTGHRCGRRPLGHCERTGVIASERASWQATGRHCERSEAIQWARSQRRGLDCFVAYAPRNDRASRHPLPRGEREGRCRWPRQSRKGRATDRGGEIEQEIQRRFVTGGMAGAVQRGGCGGAARILQHLRALARLRQRPVPQGPRLPRRSARLPPARHMHRPLRDPA